MAVPRDPTWEYIYSSAIARANLPAFATHHCLVGHTHVPLVFREKRSGGVEGIVVKADDDDAAGRTATHRQPG